MGPRRRTIQRPRPLTAVARVALTRPDLAPLRPLRLLQRHPGMKVIITSLINTLPPVVEVSAVVIVFHVGTRV